MKEACSSAYSRFCTVFGIKCSEVAPQFRSVTLLRLASPYSFDFKRKTPDDLAVKRYLNQVCSWRLKRQVDVDGNDVAGIRMPAVEVPRATYLGWNHRRDGFAEGELCLNTGSYLPFAETRVEREASGDPRLSIEERYPTHEAYVDKVKEAVDRLLENRLLLEEDAKRIVEQAKKSPISN